MSIFNDSRINEKFKNSEIYSSTVERKNPRDKIVRAFIIDKNSLKEIKRNPNEEIALSDGKSISLEVGCFITNNGRVLSQEMFNSNYKPATDFIKKFLSNKINNDKIEENIIERVHNKRNNTPKPRNSQKI